MDEAGYTPLQFSCSKNMLKSSEVLIDFVLQQEGAVQSPKAVDRELQLERMNRLKAWIDCPSRGKDGFTALHFASFHGNIGMIRLLVKHGADINVVNKQGINMLHVAAQGDQPVAIAYFLEKGLNINSQDKCKSTPLHWAGFSGADLTLNYILAWGGDTEMRDSKGLTPLHLAVKSAKEHRSTKGVKQLLIKGADRNALDNEGKLPVDYMPLPFDKDGKTQTQGVDPMVLDIRNCLKDEWTILGDCLMIRNTFKAQRKSPFTLICYFVLMGLTFALLQVSSY